MVITLCYLTSRYDCKFEWWLESLALQVEPEDEIHLLIVDFWAGHRALNLEAAGFAKTIQHVQPKPSVWQGEHRLTERNWFAAANARNTALCLCVTDWISYCDDLSVLTAGWLGAVREAVAGNYVVFGSYKKVRSLVVEKGRVVSCDDFEAGWDSRLRQAGGPLISCAGDQLYGCSLAGPLEAFLSVNGWPELCDGMSFEDVCMGIAMGNTNRWAFRYDKTMMTFESEEDHYAEKPFIRSDFGVSPLDKSHRALEIARNSKWFPNYFGEEGIAGLRQRILDGEPFPVMRIPDREWFTGTLLSEL